MRTVRWILCVLSVVALPAWVAAAPPPKEKPATGKEIYQRTLKSTVWVRPVTMTEKGYESRSSGSGSVIDVAKKLVLTNYHVVTNHKNAIVMFPARDAKGHLISERNHYMDLFRNRGGIKATVLATDPKRDLAILQLESLPPGTPALRLASETVGPGETVHSIGNPGASGALWAYTPGSVKAVYRKRFRSGKPGSEDLLEIDAQVVETTSPTNPGDSGGPLVNDKGELVAVTQGGIFGSDVKAISFFIEVGEVRALLKEKKIKIVAGSSTPVKPDPDVKPPTTPDKEKQEKAAAAKLEFARELARDGKAAKAIERCEEILKLYPDTKAAAEAKKLLETLK